jgi:hypothetical protein
MGFTSARTVLGRVALTACAAVTIVGLALDGSSAASGEAARLPGVIAAYQGGFVVRPAELDLTSTDGEYFAGAVKSQSIDWISWTRTAAFGKGALWVDPCGCYREGYSPHLATVRAYAVQDEHFTQLTIETPYLSGPLKVRMVYERGFGGAYRFETQPSPRKSG